MSQLIAVACGGALGAVLRYALQTALVGQGKFPIAILLANVLGSFLMGLLFVLIQEKQLLLPWLRPFLMVGLLGAFTTFSTFSLDTLRLLQSGDFTAAMSNIVLSVSLALLAAAAGLWLGRSIL